MFARTSRLFLRPAWAEDAPALAALLGESQVSCSLALVPQPYTLADAEAFLSAESTDHELALLIFKRTEGAPRLIGGIGLAENEFGVELGYWLDRTHWGQGYAVEAGHAVLDMARHALGLRRIVALHGIDNPNSGKVLRALGFKATGHVRKVRSLARGEVLPCAVHELNLVTSMAQDDAMRPIAA